ncbi:MAG: prephenate dehydrogenase/arogenate dehydrogenase family protein [Candidatus Bathyarchaeia archaeon]
MHAAIIGGAGRMGSWFTRYFLRRGYRVTISDVRVDRAEEVARILGAKLAKNNIEAAKAADIILISTPINVIPSVIAEIMPELERGKIIAEISSVKGGIIPSLREAARCGVSVLSLHPLFGPGAQDMEGERIALIPVSDRLFEEELAKKIFPEAELIIVDEEAHDRAMALILSLTHFINIVFASVVGEEDIGALKNLGGTTFTLQLLLSEGVMAEDPAIYASIQMDNKYTIRYLERFMSRAEDLKRIISDRSLEGFVEFYRAAQNLLGRDEDFANAYERMYRALRAAQIHPSSSYNPNL